MKIPGETLSIRLLDLIDKLASGILSPVHIKRTGRASNQIAAERILMVAQAEKIAEKIKCGEIDALTGPGKLLMFSAPRLEVEKSSKSDPADLKVAVPDYAQLAFNSAAAEQLRKDINVAKALIYAEKELEEDGSEPPAKTVEDDWLHRWREAASTTSNESMQELWGRLLAGQIKNPNSFSLRSLEALRNFSHHDAKMAEIIASYVINNEFIFDESSYKVRKVNTGKNEYVSHDLLVKAADLGLIVDIRTGTERHLESFKEGTFEVPLVCHNKIILALDKDESRHFSLPVYALTTIGRDILSLCSANANEGYMNTVAKYISADKFRVVVADVVSKDNTSLTLQNYREFQPENIADHTIDSVSKDDKRAK